MIFTFQIVTDLHVKNNKDQPKENDINQAVTQAVTYARTNEHLAWKQLYEFSFGICYI